MKSALLAAMRRDGCMGVGQPTHSESATSSTTHVPGTDLGQ